MVNLTGLMSKPEKDTSKKTFIRTCKLCGRDFIAPTNNTMRCPECRKVMRQQQSAASYKRFLTKMEMRKMREKGALKAAAANVLDAKHHPIIAIGGVSCYGQWEETCRYLQSKNIHFVADAFDSDRETNASVQKSLEKLYSIAAQYGIRMQRCDWGTAQKGVDDFLLGAAVQTDDGVILSSLWDPRNFVPPVRYIKKNIPAMFKPPVYKPKHTA